MSEGARTSGASLLSLKHFLESQYGADAFTQVLARLPPAAQKDIGTLIVPLSWYPTESVLITIDTARSLHGRGQANFYERYGVAAADFAINRFFKFMLKFTNPAWVVTRGMKVWRNYHSTGEWEFQVGERNFVGTLRKFGAVHGGYCQFLKGWMRRCGELTGAKNGRMEHPRCRATGADACVFLGSW